MSRTLTAFPADLPLDLPADLVDRLAAVKAKCYPGHEALDIGVPVMILSTELDDADQDAVLDALIDAAIREQRARRRAMAARVRFTSTAPNGEH